MNKVKQICQVLLSLFLLMGVSAGAFAQNNTVKGTVVDGAGEPVIGAHVLLQGTTSGVITDLDGAFSINAAKNSTLVVSCLGFVQQEVIVNSNNIRIVLVEDSEMLSDVVVLGYGINAKRKDLSASVGVIKDPGILADRPVSSASAMLQGQLAGVTATYSGGGPGASPSIVIRGQGSGEGVLWVVDGVPGAPVPSPNEIDAIVVLKDAASAAIYGAQSGAGGVILVTSKRAAKGAATVTYEGLVGVHQPYNLPRPLNAEEQLKMRQLSYGNAGLNVPDGWNVSKNPWVGTTRTDWMDEIFRTALYQRHNVAINGGNDTFQNRVVLSFDSEDGTMINTYNKKFQVRYNGKVEINKWLSLTQDLVWTTGHSRGTDTSSGHTGTLLSAIYMPASATVYNPLDGTYGGTTTEDPAYLEKYGDLFGGAHGDAVNPVRLLTAENKYGKTNHVYSTTNLQIANLVKGLKFNSRFSYAVYYNYYKNFTPIRDEIGKPELINTLGLGANRDSNFNWENNLSFDRTFGKHTVGALLATTASRNEWRNLWVQGNKLADESDYLQYLNMVGDGTLNAGDGYSEDANVSLVSRVSYSYDDRYFVTASFRRDYAARLPKAHNYGDFPAVTAAWKISSEPFFSKQSKIDLLKIRASFGRVGNIGSIGSTYKSNTLSKSNWVEQAVYGVEKETTYGLMIYNTKALNESLTWQTSEQINFGVDVDMFKDRLSFSVDVYNKRTFNLIQNQTMNWPSTMGLDAPKVNMGEVMNRGIELQASWSDKVGKDFSYFINGNFAYNKNWVSDIGVKNGDGTPGVWSGGGDFLQIPYLFRTCEGGPLDQFYVIKTDGIFQSDAEADAYVKDGKKIQPNAKAGDLKFVDFNNDGVIDDNDRQYIGNSVPDFTFALTIGGTWKNLSASIMLQGVQGSQTAFVGKYPLLSDVNGLFNRDSRILDAWSPTNKDSNLPILSKNDPNGNFSKPSDWYVEDTSYLRIKNFTLAYDMSKILQRASHFAARGSKLSVYFSGENLFTFTKYSGIDPEVGSRDTMTYPLARVLSFGVKLTY